MIPAERRRAHRRIRLWFGTVAILVASLLLVGGAVLLGISGGPVANVAQAQLSASAPSVPMQLLLWVATNVQ